jgi:hypothetical protein
MQYYQIAQAVKVMSVAAVFIVLAMAIVLINHIFNQR